MFYEKMFCFKRLSNFKTEAVFFILKLLIKLVYSFISIYSNPDTNLNWQICLMKSKLSLTSVKQNPACNIDDKNFTITNQDTAKCYNNRNTILAVY